MKKTVLITGASNGIGLELAKIFARENYNLMLVSRNEKKLLQLKKYLETKYNIKAHVYSKDLSIINAADDVYNFTIENNITINILVNNAAIGDFGEYKNSNWQKQYTMIQLNIVALMQLTHLFLPSMIKNKHGKILNVASIAAFQPGPLMSVYYASKAFVLSFSEALAVELKNYNIKITALCPGPTKTGFETNANLENSGLFKNLKTATAKQVAEYGYKQLTKNKTVAIQGKINQTMIFASKIMPRIIVRNFVYLIQKTR